MNMKSLCGVGMTAVLMTSGLTTGSDLLISGVYDGPLTGGTPKGVELYVLNDIADLSDYGIGSANNGGGTDGEEFTFPAVGVTAGTYLYITNNEEQFLAYFGFESDYYTGSMSINGDDAIELFQSGTVVDVFGDIYTDGDGTKWEYLDGWAYRNDGSMPNGGMFSV
ncbi:MAG TPA: nuclease, partial [Phycisphaerales bacterium]|nr:nuclease [Phycisphaerales bacterium]